MMMLKAVLTTDECHRYTRVMILAEAVRTASKILSLHDLGRHQLQLNYYFMYRTRLESTQMLAITCSLC